LYVKYYQDISTHTNIHNP